jgi:hypothetical protein
MTQLGASQPFSIDSALPERSYLGKAVSYTGVLLAQANGRLAGSLCHLDFTASAVRCPEDEYFLLNRAKMLILHRLNGFKN